MRSHIDHFNGAHWETIRFAIQELLEVKHDCAQCKFFLNNLDDPHTMRCDKFKESVPVEHQYNNECDEWRYSHVSF